ncbi:hypothetical protein EPUS_04750 [Endocarpon pusillum Z07020]|uniref:Uncharacterized protein n=1 Tax=Endocarpon pusillum (strain Z07020 / HMAS-L-300199) TaxID=1263415 RepID=U1FZU2_ENDPU|nr:uncharacterized protein EPUS_04750 [Endocarpon pusillum Z07020]ERF70472.1 hypothetical protein EPUS_04750 [Endocarpon pusillum Z07020]
MPALTTSSTPWIVRTTKRKSCSSEPQPRKRKRLSSSHDRETPGTVPKTHQQTLTQIQLTPRVPSPLEYDHMETIRPRAGPKSSRQPREPRARKGVKKQRSTLTQMDFLAMDRVHDEFGFEELGMITPDGGLGGKDVEAGKENVHLDTGKKATKAKRKNVGPVEESSTTVKGKRRKTVNYEIASDQGQYDGIPRTRSRSGAHTKVLSEQQPDRNAMNFIEERIPRVTRGTAKTQVEQVQAEPPRRYPYDEKENLDTTSAPSRLVIPETPKKPANIIPSSHSPESIPFSSRKRPVLYRVESATSPLKERSTNIVSIAALGGALAMGLSPVRKSFSPKKRICVLKYGPGLFKEPSLPEAGCIVADTGDSGPSKLRQGSRIQDGDMIIPSTEDMKRHCSAPRVSGRAGEPEIPELPTISPTAKPAFIPSSQTDTDEEDEIPETSQGLRRFTSTSSANKSEESLRMLSDTGRMPRAVKATSSNESLAQPGSGLAKAAVQGRDFGSDPNIEESILGEALSTTRQAVTDVSTADPRLPAQLLQKDSIVSTIQDSENEDDDADILFCTMSPIGAGTRTSADLARQASTSADLHPPSADTPSSPTLPPAPLHSSYPQPTTIRVPTKLPPLSSSAATSPSLPSPAPQPRYMTQQSIRPASMPRPSQVSTQAATQQSLLPMSSMPFPYTATTSSPTRYNYNAPEHVTIKDSSSIHVPLREISSQSQSQPQAEEYAMVDLGLGPDDGSLDDRDDDLDPKSSPVIAHEQQNQQLEENEQTGTAAADAHIEAAGTSVIATPNPNPETGTKDTEAELPQKKKKKKKKQQQSPARGLTLPLHEDGSITPSRPSRRRRRNDNPTSTTTTTTLKAPPPHPLARLHLSESMLESLPGPPGWVPTSPSSQRSVDAERCWDDQML